MHKWWRYYVLIIGLKLNMCILIYVYKYKNYTCIIYKLNVYNIDIYNYVYIKHSGTKKGQMYIVQILVLKKLTEKR